MIISPVGKTDHSFN